MYSSTKEWLKQSVFLTGAVVWFRRYLKPLGSPKKGKKKREIHIYLGPFLKGRLALIQDYNFVPFCILPSYVLLKVIFCVTITVSWCKGLTVFCKLELHVFGQENFALNLVLSWVRLNHLSRNRALTDK